MLSETIIHQSSVNELAEKIANILRIDFASVTQIKSTEPERPVYLTRKETANYLKVTLPTLHSYTKKGLINDHKLNGRVLYLRSDVEILPLTINNRRTE